ncbi:hypothetical protein CYY_004833 [Polysphondylium violaceum]|uniref:Carbohydrate binding domain-containing protein n=1 Tax=Polysphondylium violaceum TaxID=133409 RepID=A0A8J4V035_9MYCE|nr:hypothetical protein CYY_004833 [Polysphondylium violaceum]
MKLINLVLGLLLLIGVASATYPFPCGPHNCKKGEICRDIDKICHCIPIPDCGDVDLKIKQIGCWTQEYDDCGVKIKKTYSQYDVIIKNNSHRDIKEIVIDTDSTFKLRGNDLWNMVKLPNGDLVLPHYQNSINAGASYTFGFIVEGSSAPNLSIKAVYY